MFKSLPINLLSNTELSDDVVLLDVRTSMEYESGFIEGAINIDVMSPEFMTQVEALDKNKKYYVYCRSGARSASAANAMASQGFADVANMEGGIMAWMGAVATV